MAARAKTYELYNALVEAFRERPGNASHAARQAGCDRRTASNAWRNGWPAKGAIKSPLIPIELLLRQEQADVRARAEGLAVETVQRDVADRAAAVQEAAKKNAMVQKSQEQKVAEAALATAAGLLPALHDLTPQVRALGQRLGETVKKDVEGGKVDANKALSLMQRFASLYGNIISNVNQAVTLSRKVAGEPDKIIEHTGGVTHELQPSVVEELFGGDASRVLAATQSILDGNPNEDALLLLEESLKAPVETAAGTVPPLH